MVNKLLARGPIDHEISPTCQLADQRQNAEKKNCVCNHQPRNARNRDIREVVLWPGRGKFRAVCHGGYSTSASDSCAFSRRLKSFLSTRSREFQALAARDHVCMGASRFHPLKAPERSSIMPKIREHSFTCYTLKPCIQDQPARFAMHTTVYTALGTLVWTASLSC